MLIKKYNILITCFSYKIKEKGTEIEKDFFRIYAKDLNRGTLLNPMVKNDKGGMCYPSFETYDEALKFIKKEIRKHLRNK